MEATDPKYPHDDPRFKPEVSTMSLAEVEAWLRFVPPEPTPGPDEPYAVYMQRQSYYTQYVNKMILARDEYQMEVEKLTTAPPAVGADIEEVVSWVQRTGETPIEFLTKTYRSTSAKMADRITAASRVMDYVHRRMPTSSVVKQEGGPTTEEQQEALDRVKRIEAMLLGATRDKLKRVK